MANIQFFKVTALPTPCQANSFYYVKNGSTAKGYLTDTSGTPYGINNADAVVNAVNGLNGTVQLELSLSGGVLTLTGGANPVNLDVRYFKTTDILPWSQLSGIPTTVAGYGITDAYTKTQSDAITGALTNLTTNSKTNLVSAINEINTAVADQLQVPNPIDCSANPNYPASVKGVTYKVTVAGMIGGASGVLVETGDLIICSATNGGGDQATVGTSFFIVQSNLDSATTTVKGTGRIATQAEADAGTEAAAWITPATLAANAKWGNYYTKTASDGRYLQSFTETDPVFSASPAYGIASTDITNWNTAYSKSHDALTIGTANGLSLATQVLSLALATTSVSGAMSSTDKSKLDGIASGANNYSLPIASASILGGVKIGSNMSVDGTGVLTANNQMIWAQTDW